jgi:hypothetical protein
MSNVLKAKVQAVDNKTLRVRICDRQGNCHVQAELELVDTGSRMVGSLWTASVLHEAGIRESNLTGKVLQVKPESVVGSCTLARTLREAAPRLVQSVVQSLYAGRFGKSVHFVTNDTTRYIHPTVGSGRAKYHTLKLLV